MLKKRHVCEPGHQIELFLIIGIWLGKYGFSGVAITPLRSLSSYLTHTHIEISSNQ